MITVFTIDEIINQHAVNMISQKVLIPGGGGVLSQKVDYSLGP